MSNKTDEKHVGIVALECYTPSTFIKQSSLEEYNQVSPGKYTLGLGQEGLAVTGDAEDVNSMALTVVQSLMEKYSLDKNEIGRLEVGTESLVDKSKSTKTILMDLFAPDNTDIEGATVLNACYGGTAALLNAFLWVESDGWDGRYALVVTADIASYAAGPARPTCGAGAVAVLVGRDAPLYWNPKERTTHASNVWDFYKPNPLVEYPTVNGALSQTCYYQALEDVYERFCDKLEAENFNAESPDYWVFHAPYNKLVQKSYARLFLTDARRRKNSTNQDEKDALLQQWLDQPMEETYSDKALEKALKTASAPSFGTKLEDSNATSKAVGNTYTASVFLGLCSLVDGAGRRNELTPSKTICVFSYGSGALATMYRLTVREPTDSRFTIQNMVQALNLQQRLSSREEVNAKELDYALDTRAYMHHGASLPYTPLYPTVGRLFPGTYYLKEMDANSIRTYARVPLDAKMEPHGTPLASKRVLELLEQPPGDDEERASRRVACVVSGTAAGLPGRDQVFCPDNLQRLIQADPSCITPINETLVQQFLEKNVVQIKKHKDGTVEKYPVDTVDKSIKLAAQLGSIDLNASYGVPKGLAETMDVAAQVAVAAGLEALKSAGLVSGQTSSPEDWIIDEQYQASTGVVYASSFPAMDAAVGEVMRYLQSKTVGTADTMRLVSELRNRMVQTSGTLTDEDEAAFAHLLMRSNEKQQNGHHHQEYVFDRKFLFRVLVLGNAQLAQLAKCRGPNSQTNAACAGTTQAIAMAQDILSSGRADRVVVVAGDNASGKALLPWLGSGFRALGAATTAGDVAVAACPFDKRRSGMLLGAGAIGMVLETEKSFQERHKLSLSANATRPVELKARLLATQYSNSAFHGAALDRHHIGDEMTRFLNYVERVHGIPKEDIASQGVYFSHETCTHASDASSCAGNEVAALRMAFGDELVSKMLILNTKGFTGHPMGVSFEDVTAVQVLLEQHVPPIPNHKEHDAYLGDLKLSKGGAYPCRYAFRFAAGFGSQVAFALYATADYNKK